MPLPLILGGIAAAAAVGGLAGASSGASKMAKAQKTMKDAKERHEKNLKDFENQNSITCADMDALGTMELEILKGFDVFSRVFEKIKNCPEFKAYEKEDIQIPAYDGEKLREVSIGAGVLIGGLGGAALGTAGGFAAAGAATSAVMALGTASTGTAIATLSGAAATNATLAALGGGALAAGGGGIALGTTMLGATTAGIGILIGGVIFGIVGNSLSSKADVAWEQMREAELQIWKTCDYMKRLSRIANRFYDSLHSVKDIYEREMENMRARVEIFGLTDYTDYNSAQRKNVENTVLLVQLLYRMCQTRFLLNGEDESDINRINTEEINDVINDSRRFLETKFNTV